MKALFIIFTITILSSPSLAIEAGLPSTLGQADQREKELDLETETLQIHDLEGERKLAAEEAKRQENEEKNLQKKLSEVQKQKEITLESSKRDIAIYEARRIKAESDQKKYQAEIAKIQAEIRKLQAQVQSASNASKRAEGMVEAGRPELAAAKAKREELLKAYKQMSAAALKANNETQKLKKEYREITSQNKRIESNINQRKQRLPASTSK